jgi:hypothetical protein
LRIAGPLLPSFSPKSGVGDAGLLSGEDPTPRVKLGNTADDASWSLVGIVTESDFLWVKIETPV